MLLTESKALSKFCPHAQGKCQASGCMMWVQVESGNNSLPPKVRTPLIGTKVDEAQQLGYKKVKTTDDFIYWELPGVYEAGGKGYCSLVAPPQPQPKGGKSIGESRVTQSAHSNTQHNPYTRPVTETGQKIKTDKGYELDLDIINKLAGQE